MVLSHRRGCGGTLRQKKLALDAQQLGHPPAFFGVLGAVDRFIDRGKSRGDLAGTAQGFCHHTRKREQPQVGPGFTEFVKAGAQQTQSGGDIPALDDEQSLMAVAPGVPDRQRMSCRMVEQHSP
jgi:hypothetical protein